MPKWRALAAWAAPHAARHGGRAPTVWLDALCAPHGASHEEHLARTPVVMARARGLLVLWGPSLLDRMYPVLELVLWLALRGELSAVTVLPVAQTDADFDAIVASVDAFAVMYSRAREERVEVALVRAFELATVPTINEAVRAFLPAVRAAVDRERERRRDALSAGVA